VIYLSGTIRPNMKPHPMLGFMNTPRRREDVPDGAAWAADTGIFGCPQLHDDDAYLRWLDGKPRERCLFATAPDVVGDHAATLVRSIPMLRRIRDAGYRPALVAQDGWDPRSVPWEDFDVLFVGGTNGFKLGVAGFAVDQALARGKAAHMGRVNSYKRLRVAAALGCDSADGTFLKFGPDVNEPRLLRWFEQLRAEPLLPLGAVLDQLWK
jgi:hypothetical protein